MVSEIAKEVLKARYFRKGETKWEDVCRRVADFIGDSEEERKEYYKLLANMDFIPNSPTLMNAGTELGQLSACFVLPVEDSIDGIFNAIHWGARIHQSGGGTGYSFSKLRPEGSPVKSSDGVASGPVSFMKVFDAATEQIKQGGRRRGANMGLLNIDHSDVMKFIKCKTTEGIISNFNISVMVPDSFMEDPDDKKIDAIVDGIHKNGEPGVLFYDAINRTNPTPNLGDIVATNPCGEQPLLSFESCNLGSINLANFVKGEIIDMKKLREVVRSSIRFLDKVIDKNKYPIDEIRNATLKTRKIGLGVMGWHDMLITLGISYDSDKAIKLAEEIMKDINDTALDESMLLAKKYGPFPAIKGSIYDYDVRNAARTTIAPTGSISIIADASSGIEPVFSWVLKRKNTVGKEFFVVHPLFKDALKEAIKSTKSPNGDLYEDALKHCYEKGTIQDIPWMSEEFKSIYKSALDIGFKDHIRMQAAFQKYTDNAISKTINMPQTATKDDIRDALFLAWKLGCKGITIYRQGSRDKEVLTLKKQESPIVDPLAYKRPRDLPGYTSKRRTGCGKLFVTINERDGRPYEIFINSEGGGCNAFSNALGRSLSLALRFGTPVRDIIKQLSRVKCPVAMRNARSEGDSCAHIIAKCLTEFIPDQDEEVVAAAAKPTTITTTQVTVDNASKCPTCGSRLEFGEGCNRGSCKICGWSGCN
jgi:ribonucleoside-diphosphate reductase alpha chain